MNTVRLLLVCAVCLAVGYLLLSGSESARVLPVLQSFASDQAADLSAEEHEPAIGSGTIRERSVQVASELTESDGTSVLAVDPFLGPVDDFLGASAELDAEGWRNEMVIMDALSATALRDRLVASVTCSANRCAIAIELADHTALTEFVERYVPNFGNVGAIRSAAMGDGRFGLELRVFL